MTARRRTPPPTMPVVVEEDEPPTVADIVEILSEVYKQIRLISKRLDAIDAKIVGGTSVVAPTTGRTRPVTLVGRKDSK